MMIDLPIRRGYEGPNRVSTCQFLRMRPLWLNYDGSEKLTDFQVKCVLTPSDIPFEKLRADKQDLLFVDNNNEPIPYWIEKADSTEIIVWLKFSKIIPGKEVFWLYYGNGNFLGASDISKVFEFLDDFEDGDISDWNTYNGNWNASNGYLEQTSTALNGYRAKHSTFNIGRDIIIEAKVKASEDYMRGIVYAEDFNTNRDGVNGYLFDFKASAIRLNYISGDDWTGSPGPISKEVSLTVDEWYTLRLYVLSNGTVKGEVAETGDSLSFTESTYTSGGVGVSVFDGDGYWDDIRVCKYASPEPSVSV